MEILSRKNHQQLLDYLPQIKTSVQEWQLVEIRSVKESAPEFNISNVAELVCPLFKDKEGRLYICNDHEILMLLRWGRDRPAPEITSTIDNRLPKGICKVSSHELTPEGLVKIEIMLTGKGTPTPSIADIRSARRENVVLVADDDMYMRLLVRRAVEPQCTVHEVADGNEVLAAYQKYAPDMLLLDIHLPGKDGTKALHDIFAVDPKAYIVMLSADSSVENVGYSIHEGAKGFITKPFTKEKLQEYMRKCRTIS